jgi:hypothetical protein
MFANVAISIAVDLGLDKRHLDSNLTFNVDINTTGLLDGDGYSKAAQRAYLGCYYLSSSYVLIFLLYVAY